MFYGIAEHEVADSRFAIVFFFLFFCFLLFFFLFFFFFLGNCLFFSLCHK